jgi:hypothetical protein
MQVNRGHTVAQGAARSAAIAAAVAKADEERVFPTRATVSKVFKSDIGVLGTLGRFQDSLVLFNSVYCAMFCVHFCNSILTRGEAGTVTPGNVVMCFFALLPAAVNMCVSAPMVVLRFSFVSFVIKLRPAVMGEVLEDQAESNKLRTLVHERLAESLENLEIAAAAALAEEASSKGGGNKEGQLSAYSKHLIKQVFDDLDADKSGCLDRDEFQSALQQLGVYLRWVPCSCILLVWNDDGVPN